MNRVFSAVLIILIAATIGSAQTTLYFPQVADGVQDASVTWRTTIFLTNPAAIGTSPVTGTVTFTTSQGTPFNLAVTDEVGQVSGGSVINFTILGGQTKRFESTAAGALTVGYGTVSANGTVTGTAVFSQFFNGNLVGEAGVAATTTIGRQAIFVDTLSGFNIGVAYANPSPAPTTVTLTLLSASGQLVLPTPTVTRNLAGLQHEARFVANELFGAVALVGTLQIVSDPPVAAVALRTAPNGLFTTLPPVQIALNQFVTPAIEWLQQKPWLTPLGALAHILGALQFRFG